MPSIQSTEMYSNELVNIPLHNDPNEHDEGIYRDIMPSNWYLLDELASYLIYMINHFIINSLSHL